MGDKRQATVIHSTGAVGDLVGDDLILTIATATAGGAAIYPDTVRGSVDVASLFSIVDSNGKVIIKEKLSAGSAINLSFNQINSFDYADPGYDLVVTIAGDSTPAEVYLQLNAYYY